MNIGTKGLGTGAIASLCVAAFVSTADAAIMLDELGTAAPPATLGSWTMTPFADDTRPNFSTVTSVDTPIGGSLDFSSAVSLREVGAGWATWSHGYTGDVYFTGDSSLTLTLPSQTAAFYLYTQPNSFSTFSFTVTDASGVSSTTDITGDSGAKGFGFYGTGGSTLASITVSTEPGALGFAVGEFGIAAVPLPMSGLVLLSALGAAGAAYRRRKS